MFTLETQTHFETNPAAEAANGIISLVEQHVPTDRGVPLSPRKLDEPTQKFIPRREGLVDCTVTNQEVVDRYVDPRDVGVRRATVEWSGRGLDIERTSSVFTVVMSDATEVNIWHDDTSEISYGITDNAEDYSESRETETLQAAHELLATLDA